MGRTPTNRGRIGIQPYPIDDLQLQGYVPKTLYVPDDIPIGVSIIAGKNGNSVRVPQVDDAGNLHTTHASSTLLYSKNQIHSFIDNTDIVDTSIISDIWMPDGLQFLLYFGIVSVSIPSDLLTFSVIPIDSRGIRYGSEGLGSIILSDPGRTMLVDLAQDYVAHHMDFYFTFGNPANFATIYIDIENVTK